MADPGRLSDLGRFTPVLAWNRRGPAHRALAQIAYRTAAPHWGREAWFLGARATAAAVDRILHENPPDVVHAAYWYTLRHLGRRPRPPLWVVDTHDVQFERSIALAARVSDRERAAEIRELARNDLVVAITPKDAATFRSLLGTAARIETIGMGVDLEHWSRAAVPAATRDGETGGPRAAGRPRGPVVFYGFMGIEPNRSAAIHLCREILPALRRSVPGAEVVIAGADPAPDVVRLADLPGVTVTGRLDDPRPLLASCAVMALCIRAASGIRSRACEVMGLEVPIVSYPEALDGMGFEPERDFLQAEDAATFASQLARLIADPSEAARIAASARSEVVSRYGIDATYGRFVDLYGSLLDAPRPA